MDWEPNEKQSDLTTVQLIRHGNYSFYLFEIFIELLKLCAMMTATFFSSIDTLWNLRKKTKMRRTYIAGAEKEWRGKWLNEKNN